MTQEEQRIALAEWDGWNTTKEQLGGVFIYRDPKGNIAGMLPNYLSDLNAVHELEKKIRENQFHYVNYPHSLFEVVTGKRWNGDMGYFMFTLINATASQRCEALCRILWPERWTAANAERGRE